MEIVFKNFKKGAFKNQSYNRIYSFSSNDVATSTSTPPPPLLRVNFFFSAILITCTLECLVLEQYEAAFRVCKDSQITSC